MLLQNVAIDGGWEFPVTASVFSSPAPIHVVVCEFQRSHKSFTVYIPLIPRVPGGAQRRSSRGRMPATAHILVCRSEGALAGYVDCVAAEEGLAIIAANL